MRRLAAAFGHRGDRDKSGGKPPHSKGRETGRQPIALQVDALIKTVPLFLNDAQIGTVIGSSWRTTIDLRARVKEGRGFTR